MNRYLSYLRRRVSSRLNIIKEFPCLCYLRLWPQQAVGWKKAGGGRGGEEMKKKKNLHWAALQNSTTFLAPEAVTEVLKSNQWPGIRKCYVAGVRWTLTSSVLLQKSWLLKLNSDAIHANIQSQARSEVQRCFQTANNKCGYYTSRTLKPWWRGRDNFREDAQLVRINCLWCFGHLMNVIGYKEEMLRLFANMCEGGSV